MVQPITELAKKNIDHNARKNEKFIDLTLKSDNQVRETFILQRDVLELKKMPKDI